MKAASLLLRDLRDPRLAGASITRVEMTADLSRARIYYRLLPGMGTVANAEAAAEAAGRFLRRELGRTLRLKQIPEVELLHDDIPDDAARVEALLDSVRARPAPGDGSDSDDSNDSVDSDDGTDDEE